MKTSSSVTTQAAASRHRLYVMVIMTAETGLMNSTAVSDFLRFICCFYVSMYRMTPHVGRVALWKNCSSQSSLSLMGSTRMGDGFFDRNTTKVRSQFTVNPHW